MSKALKYLGITLICFALIFGLIIRLFVIFHFTNFTGDQINDATRVMGFWEGEWPTLGSGPIAWRMVGEIYLPPLYYYITFPFTAITADLSAQAMPNAVLGFLTIPLLSLAIYQSIDNLVPEKRFFLSALAGFWYAILFKNIALSTGESLAGNPVSIPFFLLGFILIYAKQQEELRFPKVKPTEWFYWFAYGCTLTMLINLHFTPFFVMPVVFFISIMIGLFKYWKHPKTWFLPFISIITSLILMIPYWIGEINRNWINSNRIIQLITDAPSEDGLRSTLAQRLSAIYSSYFELGTDVYFIGNSFKSWLVSAIFLTTIFFITVFKFKGNQSILAIIVVIWLVFLYAYSSTDIESTYNPVFYKLLIYLFPIFLTIFSLAYLDSSKRLDKVLILLIGSGIILSVLINAKFHYNYITSRSGMPRIPNTSDIVEILTELPREATLCHPNGQYKNLKIYEYTDRYVTQRDLKIEPNCRADHYILYAKYDGLRGNFKRYTKKPLVENYPKFNLEYSLFKETPLYTIYRVNSS